MFTKLLNYLILNFLIKFLKPKKIFIQINNKGNFFKHFFVKVYLNIFGKLIKLRIYFKKMNKRKAVGKRTGFLDNLNTLLVEHISLLSKNISN